MGIADAQKRKPRRPENILGLESRDTRRLEPGEQRLHPGITVNQSPRSRHCLSSSVVRGAGFAAVGSGVSQIGRLAGSAAVASVDSQIGRLAGSAAAGSGVSQIGRLAASAAVASGVSQIGRLVSRFIVLYLCQFMVLWSGNKGLQEVLENHTYSRYTLEYPFSRRQPIILTEAAAGWA